LVLADQPTGDDPRLRPAPPVALVTVEVLGFGKSSAYRQPPDLLTDPLR
jgi:hypothetical protein